MTQLDALRFPENAGGAGLGVVLILSDESPVPRRNSDRPRSVHVQRRRGSAAQASAFFAQRQPGHPMRCQLLGKWFKSDWDWGSVFMH